MLTLDRMSPKVESSIYVKLGLLRICPVIWGLQREQEIYRKLR
jgi:hypothetical protein